MLFDYHQKQNAKKPNSIHATYLLTGTKRSAEPAKRTNGRNGEDVHMRSSPFMSSMPGQDDAAEDSAEDSVDETEDEDEPLKVKTTIIQLISEEELEGGCHTRGQGCSS
jgi:DNA polymerase delta subunit 3